MVKLAEITAVIENKFPLEYAENFDNVGLLVGRHDKEVSRIILCLDANKNVVKEAIEKGAQLIITHHPVIFTPLKNVTDTTDAGEMLVSALENGISIYSAHTNLDSAPEGLTDTVCLMLDLVPFSNLEGNLGRLCKTEKGTTAKSLCERIKREFSIDTLFSTFTKDKKINTVAVCNGGGGGELVDIVRAVGADVYISGDLKHHEMSAFKTDDKSDFIQMQHFDSEKIAPYIIKELLLKAFGKSIDLIVSEAEVSPLLDTDKIL